MFSKSFCLTTLILSFLMMASLEAHENTIYPIVKDKKIGKSEISIWIDPDLGKTSFSIFIEKELNPEWTIEVSAIPANEPNHRLNSIAQLTKNIPTRLTYTVTLPLDRPIMWNVEFVIKENGKLLSQFSVPAEIDPPGPNKSEFALYFIPFLLVGFIGIRVIVAKRKQSPS